MSRESPTKRRGRGERVRDRVSGAAGWRSPAAWKGCRIGRGGEDRWLSRTSTIKRISIGTYRGDAATGRSATPGTLRGSGSGEGDRHEAGARSSRGPVRRTRNVSPAAERLWVRWRRSGKRIGRPSPIPSEAGARLPRERLLAGERWWDLLPIVPGWSLAEEAGRQIRPSSRDWFYRQCSVSLAGKKPHSPRSAALLRLNDVVCQAR